MADKWITVKDKEKNRHVRLTGIKESKPTLELKMGYGDVNPSRKETLTLEHVYGKGGSRGVQESEAELSAWLVGKHFGYDFRDSAPYIKGWSSRQDFEEDNVDRSMKTAAWIIKNVDLEELKGKSLPESSVSVATTRKTIVK